MAWSTRELAELAGTTVNTVRHYHRLGLLPEPDRRSNGYKQYEVSDLLRLLRIRRLVDLGVPLSQIEEVGAGADSTADALRKLDAELAAQIDRLQRARAGIAAILRDTTSVDVPEAFQSVASGLSEADKSMLHLYARVYDENALSDVRQMIIADTGDPSAEVDRLPPDADEETRAELVERLVPTLTRVFLDYPWLTDPASRLPEQRHVTKQMFTDAVTQLYNPAQLDVLYRASRTALEHARKLEDTGAAED